MSQMEHTFRQMLSKRPDIQRSYAEGLINRRALARYLVKEGVAKQNQFEAVVAMLRRYEFRKLAPHDREIFTSIRMALKDGILIFDFEKQKEVVMRLQKIIAYTNYDSGDTLKIVVGTSSVKLFIDEYKESEIKEHISMLKVKNKVRHVSEISLQFSEKANKARGIISAITNELTLHDIVIAELLTATPELLIYVSDHDVLKACEIIKGLRESSG